MRESPLLHTKVEKVPAVKLQQLRRLCVISSLLCMLTAGCMRQHFPKYPANFREYAYVTNGGSNTVSVLDLVNLRQDRVIAVGANPTGVTISPRRNEVYVVDTGSGAVSVIDAEKNSVTATIPVHRQPYFLSVDAQGNRGYVANAGSNNVSVIDLVQRRVIATIGVGEAPGLARISPDGDSLVVTNRAGGSVSVIDPQTFKIRAVFTGCPQATDSVILPDSSKTFVACSGGHQVMVIGLAKPQSAYDDQHRDRLLTFLDVGKAPVHLALKPDGGEIFVSNFDSDTISEIATGANEVGGAYMVATRPSGGIVSADNATLWISNFNADTIGVYSIDDGKLVNTINVGDGPDQLALASNGFLLLAVDTRSGDVSVVRTISYAPNGAVHAGSLFTMLPVGVHPNDIAVKSFRLE
jgi:YVTN family beta-propeller protein